MTEPDTRGRSQIQEIVEQLRSPISDLSTLLALLAGPLDAIGLLPPRFRAYNTSPLPRPLLDDRGRGGGLNIRKHIPQLQRVLLSHILPTWGQIAEEENGNLLVLVDQYFCPDGFVNTQKAAGDVALVAYATLMSPATTLTSPGGYGMKILARLVVEYPVDRLHKANFHGGDGIVRSVEWEDCVKDVCKVPTVVANAVAGKGSIPDALENGTYFNRLSVRCEELIYSFSETGKHEEQSLESITYLLTKLVNLGIFPPRPPVARSQPSFFQTTIQSIRLHLHSEKYARYWASLFRYIGSISSLTLQSIFGSLFGSIQISDDPSLSQDASNSTRARVKREAKLIGGLVGSLDAYISEATSLWQILTSLIVSRDWPELHARIFVAWLSGASTEINSKVLDAFLETVLDVWSSPEHIKHSTISRHRYTTSLLLLTVSYFPSSSPSIQNIVSSPEFIGAISVYISHLDPSVRRCGMLAAEVVAHLCQRKLDFGPWEGEGEGKPWCRALRVLLKEKDVNAVEEEDDQLEMDIEAEEDADSAKSTSFNNRPAPRATFVQADDAGYDSDDSLTGYASPPSSSRSSSPSISELAEIEKDPTLNVGLKKVPRPVYLAQLGELLRGMGTQTQAGPNDAHEADRVEMALNCAEELVRRKEGYGAELDENAVNLVYALLSLQDNFDLEGFSEKRQGAMNALVACAPRKTSPALIQEFFKNQYSADQRFVALNALAIGARELASLPVPSSTINLERTVFPSKMLPAPLHHKYVSQSKDKGKTNKDVIPLMVEQLADHALDEDSKEAKRATSSPALIRERRLRVQKPQRVTELSSSPSSSTLNPYTHQPHQTTQLPIPDTKFIDIAAEYFILPLISSFWAFLRDEQTREANTAHRSGRARYRGAGTGLILNPLVLAQMVRTLAIMVHASRNAREWMAVVAPEALELAVTLGTRPVSRIDDDEEAGENAEKQQKDGDFSTNKEASLLTSTLELALVVLDGALELDGGRILGLENTALVLGLGEWAGKVFAGLEKGLKVQGGGGVHEAKLSRAAAGVLIKVDELSSRWSRSMIDTR